MPPMPTLPIPDRDSTPDPTRTIWQGWYTGDSGDEHPPPRPAVEQALAERTRVLVRPAEICICPACGEPHPAGPET